jgi:diadenosine tetraphosphatase ApaH/serine/threonine PP2A family protein phosphatase
VLNDGSIAARPLLEVEADAAGVAASLILCGHTHIPRVVRLSDGRLVVNPGSVGCPGYDGHRPVYHKVETGTPDACYLVGLEHHLPVRGLRPYGDGGAGTPKRPSGVGQRTRDRLDRVRRQ